MNKITKKIITTTLVTMGATTAIGCANNTSKIAQKINNGVNEFVSSINKLDYVDTNNTNANLGKIVSANYDSNFLTKITKDANIENTITSPTDRSDNFKLYVLSESPFISLTSSDNNLNITMQFSTEKIETTSDEINEKINKLILKRAILMIYVNEIYNGNVNLSEENKKAINAYVNVIKENASFLNGNRGMVKNQLGMASDLINNQNNENIVNYYIIKSGEALEIRSNKIDSTISSIDSIISILEQNLTSSSCYYQNNLTSAYDNMLSNISNETSDENKQLAKSIAESINLIKPDSSNSNEANNNSQSSTTTQSNRATITNNNSNNKSNCINCPPSLSGDASNITNQFNQSSTPSNNTTTNNNINHENELTTLEEKTQDRSVFDEKAPNSQKYSDLTPSQRARLRREKRRREQSNFNSTTDINNPVNPTARSKNNFTNQYQNQNQSEQNSTNANRLNNYNNTINHTTNNTPVNNEENKTTRATRVPYRVTNNNIQ